MVWPLSVDWLHRQVHERTVGVGFVTCHEVHGVVIWTSDVVVQRGSSGGSLVVASSGV